jgi:hypothetical protein
MPPLRPPVPGRPAPDSPLINEISESSNEQSQGLDQVNQAIVQIEGVTQKNAAGAEEMASKMAFFQVETRNPKLLPAPED